MEGTQKTTSSRLTLWSIWLLALLPLVGAVLAYGLQLPVTSGSINQGELLEPVRPLSHWGGDADRFTGHWTLVLKGDGQCDSDCEQQLERMRSVHDALGRDADRVRVQTVQAPAVPSLGSGIWLVDPYGNLVLHYTREQLGEPLLQDLKRLLKISKVG